MKQFLIFMVLAFCLNSCIVSKDQGTQQKIENYFPKVLEGVKFGMTLSEVNAIRKKIAPIHYIKDDFNFRKEFVEDFRNDTLAQAVYYFDADAEQPFYELILTYKTVEARDAEALALLGKPNFNKEEWRFTTTNNLKLQAWTFDKKLILMAMLPNIEWSNK